MECIKKQRHDEFIFTAIKDKNKRVSFAPYWLYRVLLCIDIEINWLVESIQQFINFRLHLLNLFENDPNNLTKLLKTKTEKYSFRKFSREMSRIGIVKVKNACHGCVWRIWNLTTQKIQNQALHKFGSASSAIKSVSISSYHNKCVLKRLCIEQDHFHKIVNTFIKHESISWAVMEKFRNIQEICWYFLRFMRPHGKRNPRCILKEDLELCQVNRHEKIVGQLVAVKQYQDNNQKVSQ